MLPRTQRPAQMPPLILKYPGQIETPEFSQGIGDIFSSAIIAPHQN